MGEASISGYPAHLPWVGPTFQDADVSNHLPQGNSSQPHLSVYRKVSGVSKITGAALIAVPGVLLKCLVCQCPFYLNCEFPWRTGGIQKALLYQQASHADLANSVTALNLKLEHWFCVR